MSETAEHGDDAVRAEEERWMRVALEEAAAAEALGEVPVGAVIVRGGELVARGHNLTHTLQDPSAHAEMVAIRRAAQATGHWRLLDCTLYVTLEPCSMCSGGIVLSRLPRLVFGAWDPKAGMTGSLGNLVQHPRLNHRVALTPSVLEQECGDVLRAFFRARRRARAIADGPTTAAADVQSAPSAERGGRASEGGSLHKGGGSAP